ncbi:hypothetical protein K7X08_016125 [Anisodus acutangulus]|uniref:Uncharacterized protein n=1 Tax=Anisodus acutangulus TaxID=402998 RepID=A0A9Q1LG76_9SOLA|nr:hypothetical protein K7X08_016125 [Anisodus acutangulus]
MDSLGRFQFYLFYIMIIENNSVQSSGLQLLWCVLVKRSSPAQASRLALRSRSNGSSINLRTFAFKFVGHFVR